MIPPNSDKCPRCGCLKFITRPLCTPCKWSVFSKVPDETQAKNYADLYLAEGDPAIEGGAYSSPSPPQPVHDPTWDLFAPPTSAWPQQITFGRLTFARLEVGPQWRWVIVTDYESPSKFTDLVCSFQAPPNEQDLCLILATLSASRP